MKRRKGCWCKSPLALLHIDLAHLILPIIAATLLRNKYGHLNAYPIESMAPICHHVVEGLGSGDWLGLKSRTREFVADV